MSQNEKKGTRRKANSSKKWSGARRPAGPATTALVPLRELYAVNDQGLHLNTEGTRRLRQFFINTVAHLIHDI